MKKNFYLHKTGERLDKLLKCVEKESIEESLAIEYMRSQV